ncbi:hypothetical protein Hanom_Chr04g00377281 [Helianthus anomalus]
MAARRWVVVHLGWLRRVEPRDIPARLQITRFHDFSNTDCGGFEDRNKIDSLASNGAHELNSCNLSANGSYWLNKYH